MPSQRSTGVFLVIVLGGLALLSGLDKKKPVDLEDLAQRTTAAELQASEQERNTRRALAAAEARQKARQEADEAERRRVSSELKTDVEDAANPRQTEPVLGKGHLLISSMPVGFASGVKTMLLPMLMLAGYTGRTAVLPKAQFGIPAFRSTTDSTFLPLSEFLDMDKLQRQMSCVKMMEFEDWKEVTGGVVTAMLQVGLPQEVGTPQYSGSGAINPKAPDVAFDCPSLQKLRVAHRKPVKESPHEVFWAGPNGFAEEALYIHRTERLEYRRLLCQSFNASQSAEWAFGLLQPERSVMIYNVPGMIRGPFTVGGGFQQKPVQVYRDVPREDLCMKGNNPGFPSFNTWPDLAPHWEEYVDNYINNVLGKDFSCVHIRVEKLMLRATKMGRVRGMTKVTSGNKFLQKCTESMFKKIARQRGKLFIATDMDASMGSPSAARSRVLSTYMTDTLEALKKRFPGAKFFCGSREHEEAKMGDGRVAKVLQAFHGNCAMAEVGVCRRAASRIRFGTGSMGDFVMGNEKHGTWYQSCKDIIDGKSSPMDTNSLAPTPPLSE